MSQETCREQPTRCGLRDTVREPPNALQRTTRLRSVEHSFFVEIVAVGHTRGLYSGPCLEGKKEVPTYDQRACL
jgi:hypothetical protein